ncbi:hypothetical protein LTR62_000110 [Meristemomyces frigidus]|uniref:WD repeat-containing protein 44 n=1 Tax=Meristemomyces frigidus TaxID=1508187 RepID=A0AAN7TYQ4_9PEZI|nr:hypothetical protein LTR62_000110 [Meristemomyces frigidus]
MTESGNANIPQIFLTDPSNHDRAPTSTRSPVKDHDNHLYNMGDARAGAANDRSVSPGSNRPGSSSYGSAWPSTPPDGRQRRASTDASSMMSSSTRGVGGTDHAPNDAPAPMDPLSQHLINRTNANIAMPSSNGRPRSRGGSPPKERPHSKERSPSRSQQSGATNSTSEGAVKDLRKGVKAVSFLSKLMGGAKKRSPAEAIAEERALEEDAERPEGTEATVFAPTPGNISYSPRHPQPPGYIKVRSKNKQKRDFDRLFLAQELDSRPRPKLERRTSKLVRKATPILGTDHTIWAMEFSKDGKYLATAGADKIVRVWAVLASSEDRDKYERQEAMDDQANGPDQSLRHIKAPVFQSRPVREFRGHTSTILDLSWSKNNFLLSSSMDKTVRLWHMSREECLCTFKHNDFVPSIAFHPKDDRFFLAGSLDKKLRLWSIPDKSVAYAAQVPDMITAVTFSPDGRYAMAGCFSSLVMFFETEGLKYNSQMHIRSGRGQKVRGSKITSMQTAYARTGEVKLLITSNDSRVRLYNFRDKSLELKLKGNENNSSQIRATLSECGRYVTCGSEDRRAYIWSLHHSEDEKQDKRPVESFEAHSTVTTAVCMAPAKSRHLLSKSEDPIYDLCNPPPVTLLSRAEQGESQASSRAPSVLNHPVDQDARAMPSPAYLVKASHNDGNIIVTADFTGKIKIFRQDCAAGKRGKAYDDGDRASLFSKRTGAERSSRAGSLATKASQRSLREGRPTLEGSSVPSSERIMNWRQGVASTPTLVDGGGGTGAEGKRSASKSGSRGASTDRVKSNATATSDRAAGAAPQSFAGRNGDGHLNEPSLGTSTVKDSHDDDGVRKPSPLPKHSDTNPLRIQNGQSFAFWDTAQYKDQFARLQQLDLERNAAAAGGGEEPSRAGSVTDGRDGGSAEHSHVAVRPGFRKDMSYVSRLSDERSSGGTTEEEGEEGDDVFVEAREDGHGGG